MYGGNYSPYSPSHGNVEASGGMIFPPGVLTAGAGAAPSTAPVQQHGREYELFGDYDVSGVPMLDGVEYIEHNPKFQEVISTELYADFAKLGVARDIFILESTLVDLVKATGSKYASSIDSLKEIYFAARREGNDKKIPGVALHAFVKSYVSRARLLVSNISSTRSNWLKLQERLQVLDREIADSIANDPIRSAMLASPAFSMDEFLKAAYAQDGPSVGELSVHMLNLTASLPRLPEAIRGLIGAANLEGSNPYSPVALGELSVVFMFQGQEMDTSFENLVRDGMVPTVASAYVNELVTFTTSPDDMNTLLTAQVRYRLAEGHHVLLVGQYSFDVRAVTDDKPLRVVGEIADGVKFNMTLRWTRQKARMLLEKRENLLKSRGALRIDLENAKSELTALVQPFSVLAEMSLQDRLAKSIGDSLKNVFQTSSSNQVINMLTSIVGVLTMFVCFNRSDFLTMVLCGALMLSNVNPRRWTTKMYIAFCVGFIISIVIDAVWLSFHWSSNDTQGVLDTVSRLITLCAMVVKAPLVVFIWKCYRDLLKREQLLENAELPTHVDAQPPLRYV